MKKLFSILRMCETSMLQSKWLELERCSYPDRLSPYHRLDGYSVIVDPGKEDVFREWVDSHVSAAGVGGGAVDYADAIIPVLSMMTGQGFYAISEAMLAYYSDFGAMMHYCAYSPEAERLDAFGGEVIPIAEEEVAEAEPVPEVEVPAIIPEVEQMLSTPISQPTTKVETIPPTKAETALVIEQEPERTEPARTELFTDEQVQRIVAYLLTLGSEEVATAFLRSLRDTYREEERHGITTLLLRMFDHLSAKEQKGEKHEA